MLKKVGKPIPATYEELETAEAIRAAGIMKYPFAMLTNRLEPRRRGCKYLGHGGEFFKFSRSFS